MNRQLRRTQNNQILQAVFLSLKQFLYNYYYYDYYYYVSTALCWALADFSVSWSYTQSVGPLGRGFGPSQGRYLHTGQHKHRINAHRHPCFKWD
jgi:hypothetical protein